MSPLPTVPSPVIPAEACLPRIYKSKPFTYVDDEYAERAIRCNRTYYEYAKDICENYRMDLRR